MKELPYLRPRGPKDPKGYGGRRYLYFEKDGMRVRIFSKPGSAEFAVTYARLRAGDRAMEHKRTFAKLSASYQRSREFNRVGKETQKRYAFDLAWIERNVGKKDPSTFRAHHIYTMMDALSDTPTTANHRLTMMRLLFDHAMKIGWRDDNPAKDVTRLKHSKRKRQPWPADMIEAFRGEATGRTLLIFELALGTGQRIADVLAMQWRHIEGDGIAVKQSKTGAELWIPFTARLSRLLAETPRQSLYIVHREDGQALGYDMAQKDIMAVRKAIGAEAYDIHSLRYAAASEIAALPGMTAEHVRSITGHTGERMATHYSMKAGQRARAKEVQEKRK